MRMSLLPELTKFLKDNRLIYTVRGYKYPTRSVVIIDGIGSCTRTFVKQVVVREDLEPYVASSGFRDVSSWWRKIGYFIQGGTPKYLYAVVVRSEN